VNEFTVVSLFPELIKAFAATGIVRRAQERGHISLNTIDPRSFTPDRRSKVDDAPYGGGPGMVMMVPALRAAIKAARSNGGERAKVAYLTPQGRCIDQQVVAELMSIGHLILVAGRYEGIDERIIERDIDMELSLGDFVMSGGEVAAMAVIDAVVRLLPGALGSDLSAQSDSFSDSLLEYPQYTRPEHTDGQSVPAVLLSGNHAEIERWRRKQSLGRTWIKRPDLLGRAGLSTLDRQLLEEFQAEERTSSAEEHHDD
jgi:tRNA (guanine37-N1)-methyltransferase